MNPRKFLGSIAATLVLAAVVLPACGRVDATGHRDLSGRKVRAVATTGMVADIVANVGGHRVEVTGLMGPGIDPHLYKASEGDVTTLTGADMIFYNGLDLEAKMADVFEKMQGAVETVAVTRGIDQSNLLAPPEFEGSFDPHVWFDVSMWVKAAERVAASLEEVDPSHADVYRANAVSYIRSLEELDEYVRAQADRVPEERRVLITAHDAFNYFGRAYEFEVRGLQGVSTVSEAGTADVGGLADFIVDRGIPAIFVESSVSPRFIEAVQAAVEARGEEVAVGGQLYSDAMGDPGTPEGTYVGMVEHNIDTIVEALLRDEGQL
jgi:manganese/zinc/iron transport system substrate-binding protein